MSVSVKNVKRMFGQQAALDGVSLDVPSPQVLGLLGPNGAGKSTLMRLIAGYLPPSEGKVEVCGKDVEEHPIDTKKYSGYLPEHNPIHLEMYVREYLDYVAHLYQLPDRKAKVEEIIERVGLPPEAHKVIGQLSKGYRQRVGLAQALIHDPQVLILDEPTSGLDPIQLVDIRNLIKEVGKKRTVILSTHIMQEVEAMCERVVMIHHGQLVADDSVANMSNQPGGLEAAFQSLGTTA
jgi:ABC-2 type transport system ATP-binding protein